jgi:hypothetical protein
LREKINEISPGFKVWQDVWGKNKINNEILCDPCASARNQDVGTPTQAGFTVMRASTTAVRSSLNDYSSSISELYS